MFRDYLSIKDGKLVLETPTGQLVEITSLDHLAEVASGDSVMCSSSIDFPEDDTSDPAVIAMCRELRSHE